MPGNYPKESIQHTEHGESLKSRIHHLCWVLITCALCSLQGLKISPHTINIDMFCYFPNFLQAVAGIIPWPCSMQFLFTSQLQLQVYIRSKFTCSVTIYETPVTCCGCTQSWVGSKFMKLLAEDLWWWTCGAKLWWNLSAEDKRRVQISHGHIHFSFLNLEFTTTLHFDVHNNMFVSCVFKFFGNDCSIDMSLYLSVSVHFL